MPKSIIKALSAAVLAVSYISSFYFAESLAHIRPPCDKADLACLLNKESLDSEEYGLIYEQTGLGKPAVDALWDKKDKAARIIGFQEQFFREAKFITIKTTPVSYEDFLSDKRAELIPVEKGDILITSAAHIFSWRNGHAAIVVDAEEGKILEAASIGIKTSVTGAAKWGKYPNFAILRLKGAEPELRAEIADFALENMNGVQYGLFAGISDMKHNNRSDKVKTQCAHLVWRAYAEFGYDIDSDKGLIVTPRDIMFSDLLETVQIYGLQRV